MKRAALISSLLVACVARPADDDAAVTTMVEGESTDESTSESSTSDDTTTEEGDGDGDGDAEGDGDSDTCDEPRKLDLPPDSEAPMPDSCTVEVIPWPTPEQYAGCEICEFETVCHFQTFLGCVTPMAGETCADICPSGDCLSVYWDSCEGDGPVGWEQVPSDTCGYYEIDGKCCTIGKFLEYCAE